MAIETASFPHPWSEVSFLTEFSKSPPTLYVARKNEQGFVLGYICFWQVADEFHLLNLAVRPDCRHQGVGQRLIQFLLQQAREKKAQQVFLEVRPSNRIALDLYRSQGFKILYRRPGYYLPEGEDALIMARFVEKGEGGLALDP